MSNVLSFTLPEGYHIAGPGADAVVACCQRRSKI